MQIMRWGQLFVLGGLLMVTLTACGGAADANIGVFKARPTDAISVSASGNSLKIDADPSGAFKFTLAETAVTTGTIKLSFNNPAPVAHNWTLVTPENADKAANEGATAGPPDYTPADKIAQTKTVIQAPSDIEFEITEPGTYIYICTVPGHYAGGMKGTLNVQGK